MIISEKIQYLLKKWDFDQALEIYLEHGDSDTMKFLFQQPWSEFIDSQLKDEIKEMARSFPIVEHEIKGPKSEVKIDQEEKRDLKKHLPARLPYQEDQIEYPEELQELVLKRKGLFSEANHFRYILFTKAESEKERKELAFKIKANFREIERIWAILNFWKEHKTLSPDIITVNTGGMTVKEMANRIKNLRTYISKSRSGKKNYKLSIDQMQAELNDLERRMNAIV